MKRTPRRSFTHAAALAAALATAAQAHAADIVFRGTHFDVGGTFFPGGELPYIVVPWRTQDLAKPLDADGDNVYGSAGYALFATRFDYPNANVTPGNGNIPPEGSATYPNLVSLPSFVVNSQVLSTNMAGGFAYALIDDPTVVNGVRDYAWGMTQSPPRPTADQSAYVKLGVLDGRDITGNHDPVVEPADRWGFEVGAGVPAKFRVGVMVDGLDGTQFVPGEVLLRQAAGGGATTGAIPLTESIVPEAGINRFVDMHFFDVANAQPGDQFYFSAQARPGGATAAIAGFSFDVNSEGALAAADFDSDGDVDGGDFLTWQQGRGIATGALREQGDATGGGRVDNGDYLVWKAQFATSGALPVAAAALEPSALALAALAIAAAPLVGRRLTRAMDFAPRRAVDANRDTPA